MQNASSSLVLRQQENVIQQTAEDKVDHHPAFLKASPLRCRTPSVRHAHVSGL